MCGGALNLSLGLGIGSIPIGQCSGGSPPPETEFRIIDNGDFRITSDGDFRIVED